MKKSRYLENLKKARPVIIKLKYAEGTITRTLYNFDKINFKVNTLHRLESMEIVK